MKNLKYLILFLGLVACSDLDEQVYSEISPTNFYRNAEEAQVAVTSIYNTYNRAIGLFDFGLVSLVTVPSPKMVAIVPWRRIWGNYTTSSGDMLSLPRVWGPLYQGIFRANTVLKEIENRDFGSEEEETKRKALIAETKWLRAWSYFQLVQLFGDVPMPLEPTTSLEGAQLSRTSTNDVYNQIISDLENAEIDLPANKRPASEIGRPIKATAKFLLAKVYLTMSGLPLEDPNAMALANIKLQEVLSLEDTDQGYSLLESYDDAIRIDNNDERIFAIQQTQAVQGQGTAIGHILAPRNKLAPGLGLSHIGYSQDFYDSFEESDERRDVTMAYTFVSRNGTVLTYNADTNGYAERLGIHQNKYVDLDQACCDGDPDMIVYRYSDALLMAAEIENALNGPTAKAYAHLNRVRRRANASNAPSGMTQEEFAEYIYEERFKELSLEFQEVYDIRRLGKVEEALSQHPENITFAPANTPYSTHFNLWPLPIGEIQTNPNITENNPGW